MRVFTVDYLAPGEIWHLILGLLLGFSPSSVFLFLSKPFYFEKKLFSNLIALYCFKFSFPSFDAPNHFLNARKSKDTHVKKKRNTTPPNKY